MQDANIGFLPSGFQHLCFPLIAFMMLLSLFY